MNIGVGVVSSLKTWCLSGAARPTNRTKESPTRPKLTASQRLASNRAKAHVKHIGGKKVYTKGVFSSESSSDSTGKNRGLVHTKNLVFKEKKAKTYTPKSLPGVCRGPLRRALVYRFWPPINMGKTPKRQMEPCSQTAIELSTAGDH